MLSKLWLKLNLYFRGVRFYEMDSTPKSAEFRRAEFKTVKGHKVVFSFYQKKCRDLIFKRGKIKEHFFTGYIVQAKFEGEMPPDLLKYNCCKMFFNGTLLSSIKEEELASYLLAIFLDFIKVELEK